MVASLCIATGIALVCLAIALLSEAFAKEQDPLLESLRADLQRAKEHWGHLNSAKHAHAQARADVALLPLSIREWIPAGVRKAFTPRELMTAEEETANAAELKATELEIAALSQSLADAQTPAGVENTAAATS